MTISSRGVTIQKHDGSVCTLVLTSRFSMVSVQHGEKKTKNKIAFFFLLNSGLLNKLLFLEINLIIIQIFLGIKKYLPQLML